MRRLEDTLRLLAERAEPLPAEVLIARIETELGWAPWAVAESKEPTMVTRQKPDLETPAATPSRRFRRGPLLAAGVAAIAVLIGFGVAWALGAFDTEAGPADGVAPQIASVTAMYAALNAPDAVAYAAYWAEDARGWGPYVWGTTLAAIGSPDMDQGFEERRAWGAQFTLSDCALVDDTVRCLETWHDRLHAIAGVTIDREVVYTFDDQGKIATMGHVNPNWEESTDFFQEFNVWVNTTYPDVAETYYIPGFSDSLRIENWFAPPENVTQLIRLIEEFVAQSDTYPLAS